MTEPSSGIRTVGPDNRVDTWGAMNMPPSPQPLSAGTLVVPATDLAASLDKGRSFVENREYRIGSARRDGPGEVEVHEADTDIFYVIDGRAILVTGGEMREARTVSPGEIRGSIIDGGEERIVRKGDLIVIPRGIPHWFKEISEGPFTYLVVKSTARA